MLRNKLVLRLAAILGVAAAGLGVGLVVDSGHQEAKAYTCVYVPTDLYNPWHCTTPIVPKGRI